MRVMFLGKMVLVFWPDVTQSIFKFNLTAKYFKYALKKEKIVRRKEFIKNAYVYVYIHWFSIRR